MSAAGGLEPKAANPCRQVRRYREGRRERFLTAVEFLRLGPVLDKLEAAGETRFRDAKTGPRVVSLSPAAAEVLAAVPR